MTTKKAILRNPSDFTLEQLVDAIDQRVVTYQEIRDNSKRPVLPSIDYKLRNYSVNPDAFLYEQIKLTGAIDWIERYIKKCPSGEHIDEVQSLKADIASKQASSAAEPQHDSTVEMQPNIQEEVRPEASVSKIIYEWQTPSNAPRSKHPGIFSTKGRVNRGEYWITQIVIYFLSYIVGFAIGDNPELAILSLLLLPMMWVSIAVSIKRSHDIGNSGWWILVPFYGLWLAFKKGDQFANDYGIK